MTAQTPNSDPKGFPRIVSVGLSGMLVSFSDQLSEEANRAALAFRATLEAANLTGITETTTSLSSAFVRYDPLVISQQVLQAHLAEMLAETDWLMVALPAARRLWRVPAVFGGVEHGPQLEEAAALAEVDATEAIAQFCAAPLRVMALGFAPGLPYLGTLPEHWNIPRLSGLTKQVSVGALAVAIRQVVLFPTASPTGWRQIGQCAFRPFRPEAAQPFALRAGDEITFHAISANELEDIRARDLSGDGGATCEALP